MTNDRRAQPPRQRRADRDERSRSGWRPGEDRDAYVAGDEKRYMSDREGGSERAFEGERNYPVSGYPEEFGYRRDRRERQRSRGGAYDAFGYTDASGRLRWRDEAPEVEYYGAGRHYGGGFGTAPSTRTSASGSWGAESYARLGAWDEREDWLPRTNPATGESASHTRSPYGAQSGYGRTYGGAERQERAPSFRGRGPKGYQRSDQRLRELICERLTDDPLIDASDTTVEVADGVVTLTGAAPSRRMKYAIEDSIEAIGGVKDVDNRLRVQPR